MLPLHHLLHMECSKSSVGLLDCATGKQQRFGGTPNVEASIIRIGLRRGEGGILCHNYNTEPPK